MSAHTTLAKPLMHASVEPCDGSWSDYERLAAGIQGDLTDGQQLATRTGVSTHDKYFAIATPLHAALGLSDLTPMEPESIGLSEDASRALCEAAHALLTQDGIAFQFVNATTWLIELPAQLDVITERPDWIIGEALRQNFPRGSDARKLERWMNELQMLLHAHPVNEARAASRLPAINVVWMWAFGSHPLTGGEGLAERMAVTQKTSASRTPSPQPSPPGGGGFLRALRMGDIALWQRMWGECESNILQSTEIILGDSRPRLHLRLRAPLLAQKISSLFAKNPTLTKTLDDLRKHL